MSEWKEYKLEDVSEPIKETYNPNRTDEYPYIGLEHIEQETLRLNSIGISSDVTSNKYLFKTNDVLFGKLRPYFRKVVKPQFDGICSTDIWVFRAKKGFDQNYLYYFLANWDFVDTANSGEGGTRMPRADWNYLRKTIWSFPDLREQGSIASILSCLDDKIDLLHRQNKTLEQLAETLFRQWFIEEADPSWKTKTISEIIEVKDGTHDSPKQCRIGFYLITSRHLKPTGIDLSTAYKISELDYKEVNKRSKVDKNDILFSMIGTLGLIHLVTNEPNYAIKNIGLFKSSQKPWFTKFLLLLLKSSIGKVFIHESANGSTQEYITLGNLRGFEFPYPGESLIKSFNKKIESLFNKMLLNSNQIRTLTQLRDSLLPKLMSGEIRVKYSNKVRHEL
jgi:type I restriction enzyme, S subunit